jgi:hypothetical protein
MHPMNYQLWIETATGGHFEPGTYTLGAARQVTMATAGDHGGMEPMDGVLLKDGERKLMFNFEEEQWMPAKSCPF